MGTKTSKKGNSSDINSVLDRAAAKARAKKIAPERPPGSFTTKELAEHLGLSDARAGVILRQMLEKGEVERVRVPMVIADNVIRRVSGFRLLEGAKDGDRS